MSYTDKQIERIAKWEQDIWLKYCDCDTNFEYQQTAIESVLKVCGGDAYQFVRAYFGRNELITDFLEMYNLIELQKIIDTKEV